MVVLVLNLIDIIISMIFFHIKEKTVLKKSTGPFLNEEIISIGTLVEKLCREQTLKIYGST